MSTQTTLRRLRSFGGDGPTEADAQQGLALNDENDAEIVPGGGSRVPRQSDARRQQEHTILSGVK